MRYRLLFSFLAVTTLGACDTLGMVRTEAPIRTDTFQGEWRAFAECVQFKLGDEAFFDSISKRAQIRDQNAGGKFMSAHNTYEISISQQDTGTVRAELRQRWIADDNAARTTRYWSAVEACGAR